MNTRSPRLTRRAFSLAALGTPLLAALARPAWAAEFPEHPVKFVVPFNPGGNVDSVGRLLAQAMGATLHQPVVVDNRSGAGGGVGASMVATSPADGYTLMVGSNGPLTINPFVQKLSYKPLEDLAPIALAGTVPHVLIVTNKLAAKNLKELVELSHHENLSCASSGLGSATHLTLARFDAQTGARIVHVPYRGGSAFVTDLISGIVQVASMELSTAVPLHKAGKARILGVAGTRRSPLVPEVPTFIESGIAGFTAESFVGLLAPAHTPKPVLGTLEKAALAALATPDMAQHLQALGIQPAIGAERSAAGFARLLKIDSERNREAVRIAGVQPE
ncbi:tripartite tricarboxylate transporter substrate binding protein [Ramlibacter sp. G-1-2-2]|uniref:Tripartite tricarboxylate transporter substrate binding protein n=1 Tax=Ramlibacter agri TaxID=2728837 RepID=A0A848H0X3_9BURK|nr:tripartite tricarboxylate transporter substrate binding protein [Ramlibacter agri]NML43282.1 tripartite tricarboxylate transporter substrate binding protein [Ramlibacter agri]